MPNSLHPPLLPLPYTSVPLTILKEKEGTNACIKAPHISWPSHFPQAPPSDSPWALGFQQCVCSPWPLTIVMSVSCIASVFAPVIAQPLDVFTWPLHLVVLKGRESRGRERRRKKKSSSMARFISQMPTTARVELSQSWEPGTQPLGPSPLQDAGMRGGARS